MARESSPTSLAPADSAPTTSGGERPSLNESLDELARLSDQLIDQLTTDPLPAVAAAAPREGKASGVTSAPRDMALGKREPDLDAIFANLEASSAVTDALPTDRVADASMEPPAAVPREHTPQNIREVLKHLETLPSADSKAPWESIEPSVVPDPHGAPGSRTIPSLMTQTESLRHTSYALGETGTSTERGRGRYWLIAAALAIAAGLAFAFLLQAPRTEKQTAPKSAVQHAAPRPATLPTRRPEPPLSTPQPPVSQDVQPPTPLETTPRIDAPAAHPTSTSSGPAKALAAPAEVPSPAKSSRPTPTRPARTAIAAPAVNPPALSMPVAQAQAAPVEPALPTEIPAPSPGPVFAGPPVSAAPPAVVSAPTDKPVETPQIEYKLLDATSNETARPIAPVPALPIYAPPRVIARTQPSYPEEARARAESGTIVLRLLINESGIVERGVVEAGIPGSKLESAAVDAALSWTYEPARQSGRPVRAWVTERITFAP